MKTTIEILFPSLTPVEADTLQGHIACLPNWRRISVYEILRKVSGAKQDETKEQEHDPHRSS